MSRKRILLLGLMILVLALPFIDNNEYHIYILDRALIHCMVATGIVFLTGLAGQISLGHAAFYGIGAYTSALLVLKMGFPIWAGMIAGAFLCFTFGVILGFPSFKLTGFFLSLVTISFGLIVLMIMVNWESLTGGPYGLLNIPGIALAGYRFSLRAYYYLFIVMLYLIYLFNKRIANSFIGRALMAIRDDELAAETVGIDSRYYKLLAFGISAAYGGLAGGFYAHLSTFLSPESFVFFESANFVAMAVVGGLRHLFGGIIGGVVVTILPEALRFRAWETYYMIASSFIILVLVVYMPEGIARALERFWRWLER